MLGLALTSLSFPFLLPWGKLMSPKKSNNHYNFSVKVQKRSSSISQNPINEIKSLPFSPFTLIPFMMVAYSMSDRENAGNCFNSVFSLQFSNLSKDTLIDIVYNTAMHPWPAGGLGRKCNSKNDFFQLIIFPALSSNVLLTCSQVLPPQESVQTRVTEYCCDPFLSHITLPNIKN